MGISRVGFLNSVMTKPMTTEVLIHIGETNQWVRLRVEDKAMAKLADG